MGTPIIDGLLSPGQTFEDFVLEKAQQGGWSQDALGALSGAFRSTGQVPGTRVRLSHALTLRVGSRIFGAAHTFAPSMHRTVDREPEIDANAHGLYAALVPQMMEGSIRLSRYDLYLTLMEEAVGSRELITLCDQSRGITLRETWRGPAGLFRGGVRAYEYYDCYFEDLGRQMDAKGDRVVSVDATLGFRDRRRVS